MKDPRYGTRRWRNLRAEVIKRDGHHCSEPGCTADLSQPGRTHVNHIHPVKDGGPFWDPLNLEVLCRSHHDVKTLEQAAARLTQKLTTPLEPTSPNG